MKRILLSGVIAIAAQSAFADDIQLKDFYIYPHYTYYDYDDLEGTSIDSGDRFGLSLGYRFTQNLGAELSWDTVDSEASGADVDTTLWELNGVYTFNPSGNWQPILLLGVGHIKNTLDAPIKKAYGTNIDAGAGINYAINDMFALRADVRAIHTFDYSTNDVMATLGFTVGFGGSSEEADTDGDGVADAKDQCVGTPIGATVDANGCEVDGDNDGVADSKDQCPSTPENAAVDANGCALDSDGDGVADYKDQCADTPENAVIDENGCRKMLTEAVSVTLALSFDNNKADIKPEFEGQIAKVAEFMNQYPDTSVVIEGYSDSMGDAGYNKALSQRRAQAVADDLVNNHHIDASRVSAIGYGEENPIADNSTREGRKANRRVVANISTTVTKPE